MKGEKRMRKQFTEEEWGAMVDFAYDKFMVGYAPSKIKVLVNRDFGLPFSQYNKLLKDVKARIVKDCDIYKDKPFELQMARLQELLNDTASQSDAQMVLKCIQEMNKLLKLYEQKISVQVVDYELEV